MYSKLDENSRIINENLTKCLLHSLEHVKNSSRVKNKLITSILEQNNVMTMNFYTIRQKQRTMRKNFHKLKMLASNLEMEKNQLEERLNIIKEILKDKDVKTVKAKLRSYDIIFSPIRMSNVHENSALKEKRLRQSAGSILDDDNFSDPGMDKKNISDFDLPNRSGTELSHYFDVVTDNFVSFPHVVEEKKIRFEDLDFINNNSKSIHSMSKNDHTVHYFTRLNRPHEFESKSALKVEHCSLCGKRIDFGKTFLRCGMCSVKVHISCKSSRLQPCLTLRQNSSSNQLNSSILNNSDMNNSELDFTEKKPFPMDKIDLGSMCPLYESPSIPSLVIFCIHEINSRGLDQLGLYRLSGSDKSTKDLFEKLTIGKYPPSMALINDINVICGCLKMFLRKLETPLIPPAQREIFEEMTSMKMSDEDFNASLYNAFSSMPRCNRDTLSYLLTHLQNVSKSPHCQMNIDNISRIFGPTLVGHNSPENMISQMMEENTIQLRIVKMLLQVSEDFYNRFLNASPPRRQFSSTGLLNQHCKTVGGFHRSGNAFDSGVYQSPSVFNKNSTNFFDNYNQTNNQLSNVNTPLSFSRSRRLFSSFKQKNR